MFLFCSAYFKLTHKQVLLICSSQPTQFKINTCTSFNPLCHFDHTVLILYVLHTIQTIYLSKSRILARSILLSTSFSEIKQTKIKISGTFYLPNNVSLIIYITMDASGENIQ